MSQTEFGEILGCTRGQVDTYENRSEPKISTLSALATKFNISLNVFFEVILNPVNIERFRWKSEFPVLKDITVHQNAQQSAVSELDGNITQENLIPMQAKAKEIIDRLIKNQYGSEEERISDLRAIEAFLDGNIQQLNKLYNSQMVMAEIIANNLNIPGLDLGQTDQKSQKE